MIESMIESWYVSALRRGDSMTLLAIFFIVTIGYMLCGSFALAK
jgi:hypothetical protein